MTVAISALCDLLAALIDICCLLIHGRREKTGISLITGS